MTQTLVQIIVALLVAGFVLVIARKLIALVPMEPLIAQIVDILLWAIVGAIILFYAIIPLLHLAASELR